jgi:hypothetical protein
MVEPVVLLLNGRGHRIIRARDAGIEAEDDQTLVEYALSKRNSLAKRIANWSPSPVTGV